ASCWGGRYWYTTPSAAPAAFADGPAMTSGEISIRVRYAETDRMGLLHHAQYLVYFESARVELLRAQGLSYRDIEDQGFYLVLTKIEVRYKRPVHFDDLVVVRATVERTTSVRIDQIGRASCRESVEIWAVTVTA